MILQALNSYYERLASEPDSEIAPFGFSRQSVSFCVIISEDGDLIGIEPLGTQDKKKISPARVVVPGVGARSGSAPKPSFLWDNALYLFGFPPQDKDEAWADIRFHSFRDRVLAECGQIEDLGAQAVCKLYENLRPRSLPDGLECPTNYYGVFRIAGHHEFVHERPAIKQWFTERYVQQNIPSEANSRSACLVSGLKSTIASSHFPKIKGIFDKPGSPAEKYLVAIDKTFSAAESYGKKQNDNAPVSETAAFQYCTALNTLLADRSRRVQIGDATTVFWTEQPTPAESFLGYLFGSPTPEDDALLNELNTTLRMIAQGKYPAEFGDQETPFYILGLSPNAARISVRFWRVSTLGDVVRHLREHFEDLLLQRREHEPEFISPWQILRETVRDSKDIPPQLSGALMRAILTGQAYPQMLLAALIRRIRADRELRYIRVATIKACLNRQIRLNSLSTKEIAMSLDTEREDVAYCLGRLFAELEKTQEDALPGINDTIKDRYFGSASATPGSVFPRLIRLSQHHLGKLEKPTRVFHEKRIQQIVDKLKHFPAHLNLQAQGLFAVGYYHQRQDFFTKKEKTSEV